MGTDRRHVDFETEQDMKTDRGEEEVIGIARRNCLLFSKDAPSFEISGSGLLIGIPFMMKLSGLVSRFG
jgi:hypothetical protein